MELQDFAAQMSQFSLEELENELEKLNTQVTQMVFNPELFSRIEIVEDLINQKKGNHINE